VAQHGNPARLNAQITYIDPAWNMMFLHCPAGTVFVVLRPGTDDLRAGDVLRVGRETCSPPSGVYIQHSRFQVLRRKPLPTPKALSLAALSTGKYEGQYVSTEGILRPNQDLWGHTHLLLVAGETSVPIVIPDGVNSSPLRLVGNKVTLRGVAGSQTSSNGQSRAAVLYVQNVNAIQPANPKWQDFLKAPVLPIASLSQVNVKQRLLPAVHLRGRVLWHAADRFVLKEQSGTILVHTPSAVNLHTGEQLDVVGFPKVSNDLDVIMDAYLHPLRSSAQKAIPSIRMSLAEAQRHGRDGEIVTMSGILTQESAKGGNYDFRIADRGRSVEVLVANNYGEGQRLVIKPGAQIEATGTLRFLHFLDGSSDSLQLLVNSPSDIVVESSKGVNWQEFLFVLGGCIALGIALWIIQMRRTLRAKTALIRAQMVQESQLEDKYRRLFERSLAAIFIWKPSGEITHCNTAFAHIMGFSSPDQVIGKSYLSLLTDSDDPSAEFTGLLDAGPIDDRESSLRRSDGRIVYLLENVTRVETEDGEYFETTALDITQSRLDRLELQRAKAAAQHEAEIDALTGLQNRRRFTQLTRRELESAEKQGTAIGLLFLDLDGFKTINDTLGHMVGDLLLQQVAGRLKNELPDGNLLARLGGDEFAALLTEPAAVADPERVAATLLLSLTKPFRIDGRELTVGASIGISLFPDLASDLSNLLQQADSAMYAAKQAGRNRAIRYNDDIGRALQEKNQITSALRGAMERGEILLHYQPEFDRVNRQIMRFEALARWNSPLLGNVPPIEFIHAAEESGLIAELGRYLLELACADAVEWQRKSGHPIPVAVNISVLQLRTEGFVEMVLEVLKRTGLSPTSLEMEMTESVMLGDYQQSQEVLAQLCASGIKLALDDFGTGYSSLSYLPELPFSRLKIDRSFLRKANRGPDGEALIDAIIGIAHRLGIAVVVEGIETSQELELIHTVGADEVQGYFLGRPGPDPCSVILRHRGNNLEDDHDNVETDQTSMQPRS
jgi:diguanylate cyclase (GGDEF)-like protein/PAS domain S-box-containing protein